MKTIDESLDWIGKFLPVPKHYIVKKIEDIPIKPPLVLKVISPYAIHKTEVKGIRIIKDQTQIKSNFNDLMKIKGAKSVLVQEYIEGIELIIGLKQDASFGHALMFGIGGIMVELLKDVSFRICPINHKDAEEMINELKAKQLLFGFRGSNPINLNLLTKCLVNVSEIPKKYPNLKELDINPLIINDKHAVVVDARLSFSDK